MNHLFAGMEHIVRENEPLGALTWLGMGGTVQYFVEPTNEDELVTIVKRCRESSVHVRLLGSGTNLLIQDEGVAGVVIRLVSPEFSDIKTSDTGISAGGGAKLSQVLSAAARDGLAGLESLVGIPGTIGGAIHGNAGTGSADIGQCVSSVVVLNRSGEIHQHQRSDMHFGHRRSSVDELAILRVQVDLEPTESKGLVKKLQKNWLKRQSTQLVDGEIGVPAFREPVGLAAATVIEQAGLKGTRVGEVEVSEKNPTFIVAHPGAKSDDVRRLLDLIKSTVLEQMGVELEVSLEIW
ncbi:MAG TPA: UDP-N-acetylmuramate dehydrogenase [Planctomycetes bacterium]|nr:UDP-N-acetylmuramate dehydrogenase [Planctomycetaceae bacterium]HIM30602.1 UDP-N-acetylmuramate dehydrogenase [Planctomycetota bacterium]